MTGAALTPDPFRADFAEVAGSTNSGSLAMAGGSGTLSFSVGSEITLHTMTGAAGTISFTAGSVWPSITAITIASAVSGCLPGVAFATSNSDRFSGARSKIAGYAARPQGWAGPMSVPASKASVLAANQFIDYLALLVAIPMPHVSLSSDGEVNFFWDNDGSMIDIGFDSAGRHSYFARLPDGTPFYGDGSSAPARLPRKIVEFLANVG